MIFNKVNIKNKVFDCLPNSVRANYYEANQWLFKQNNEIIEKYNNIAFSIINKNKESNLINSINDLFRYKDYLIEKNALDVFSIKFLDGVNKSKLSPKQISVLIKMINNVNYLAWKYDLKKEDAKKSEENILNYFEEHILYGNKKKDYEFDFEHELDDQDLSILNDNSSKEFSISRSDETEIFSEKEIQIIRSDFTDICKTELRGFQILILNWLLSIKGNCFNASVQGSGKTLVSLVYAKHLMEIGEIERVFVFCPKSVISNWYDEIDKHLVDKDHSKFHVFNYEKLLNYEFLNTANALLICDECHRVKGKHTKTYQNLYSLPFKKKLGLSGTIVDKIQDLNNLYDLFNLESPVENGKLNNSIIKRTMIRIDKSRLDLPDLFINNIPIEMEKKYSNTYKLLNEEVLKEIAGETSLHVILVKLLRLNQLCSNPNIILKNKIPISKTDKYDDLTDIISDNSSSQIIIWSSFVQTLTELKTQLMITYGENEVELIYGDTSMEKRNSIIKRFNNKEFKILLANPTTLGTGVNLQTANIMIYWDRDFSIIKQLQSQDRIHRLGQEITCYIYNLYYKNTIEEYILITLKEKENGLNNIFGNAKQVEEKMINELVNFLGGRK